jgi:hypothetical protein
MFPCLQVGYFPFVFCLATTMFNQAARFRTAASLVFICSAIVAALAQRSSSHGVQMRR